MIAPLAPAATPTPMTPAVATPAPSPGPTNPQLLALTHALALQESGSNGKPNYNAVGDNGTSHGAYQWQPGNFEAAAKEAGLDPNDRSPMNQDKVAYSQVKSMADKGLSPAQIASMWNSGSPNNFKNHSGTTVINGKPISYDTPAYVRGVQSYYKQLIGQAPQPAAAPAQGSPAAPVAPLSPVTASPASANYTGLPGLANGVSSGVFKGLTSIGTGVETGLDQTIGRGINAVSGKGFVPTTTGAQTQAKIDATHLFDANTPSEELGSDIGQSAPYLVAPEDAAAALPEAVPLITRVGQGVLRAAAGGAKDGAIGTLETHDPVQGAEIGVGSGVVRGASEAISAGANALAAAKANPAGLIEGALRSTANKYTSSQRMLADMEGKFGTNPLGVIASYGNKAIPETEGVGKINPTEAIDYLHGKIADLSGLKNEAVFNSPHSVTVPEFRTYTENTIDAQPWSAGKKAQALAETSKYFDNLDTVYGNKPLPLAEVDRIKTEQTQLSSAYGNAKAPFDYDTHGVIGKAARSLVELHADDAPTKELNKLIQSHYDAAKLLDTLRGKTPHGGALGLALSKLGGEVAGSVAGGAVGHPFIGAMAGRVVGGQIDDLLNNNLISNPLKRMIINSYKGEAPEVVGRMQQYLDANAPDISELGDHSLSARPTSSANTTAPKTTSKNGIPQKPTPMSPTRQGGGKR